MANEISVSLTLTVANPPSGGGYISSIRQNAQFTQNALGVNAEIVDVPILPTAYTFSNLTTFGWMFLQNLDAANYVDYGLLGVALAAPISGAVTPSGAGGTLAAGTYYYEVTAVTPGGETTVSAEHSVTNTGSTSSNTIPWSAVPGATGYNIYRGTTPGGENVMYSVGAVTTFTDTGAAGVAATPPASNTTNFQPVGRLKATEFAALRLTPGIAFAMKANTAPVEINFSLWND
jgi:hypothetical protein